MRASYFFHLHQRFRLLNALEAGAIDPQALEHAFAIGETAQLFVTDSSPIASCEGLSASPDGRFILFSRFDEGGSDLMRVENFR